MWLDKQKSSFVVWFITSQQKMLCCNETLIDFKKRKNLFNSPSNLLIESLEKIFVKECLGWCKFQWKLKRSSVKILTTDEK